MPFKNCLRKIPFFSAGRENSYIPFETAKHTALDHAGLSTADIDETHISHTMQLDTVIYCFTFKKASQYFKYQINAVSGEIISYCIQHD